MSYMFKKSKFNSNISEWNISKLKEVDLIFENLNLSNYTSLVFNFKKKVKKAKENKDKYEKINYTYPIFIYYKIIKKIFIFYFIIYNIIKLNKNFRVDYNKLNKRIIKN